MSTAWLRQKHPPTPHFFEHVFEQHRCDPLPCSCDRDRVAHPAPPAPGGTGNAAPAAGRGGHMAVDGPTSGGGKGSPRRNRAGEDTAGSAGTGAAIREFPDRGEAGDGLTQRQRRVLEVIRDSIERRGYPPSVREIGEAVGLSSASSVAHQLSVLQRKGWLRRDPNRPRALDVRLPGEMAGAAEPAAETALAGAGAASGVDEATAPRATYVPLVGRIAAGGPVLAEQAVEDVFPLPRELVGEGTLFMLKVAGDSMV